MGYIASSLHRNTSLSSINIHHSEVSGYLFALFLVKKVPVAAVRLGFPFWLFRNKVHGLEVILSGFCVVNLAVPFCCCDPAVAQKRLDGDQVGVGI